MQRGNVKRVASAVGEESSAIAFVHQVLTSKRGLQCRPNSKPNANRRRLNRLSLVFEGNTSRCTGLRLTLEQACRLWQVDVSTCETLLEYLVRTGVLRKTASGFYIAAVPTTPNHA